MKTKTNDRLRKAVSQEIQNRIDSLDAADAAPDPTAADPLPDVAPDAPPADEPAPTPSKKKGAARPPKAAKEPKPKKAPKPKVEKQAKAPKALKPAKEKKMSLLDAAAKILGSEPMKPADIVDAAAKRGLWTPGKGKTPAATLHAAIIREIAAKGNESRFRKHDRGLFVAR